MPSGDRPVGRALVLDPAGHDAEGLARTLAEAGIPVLVCPDLDAFRAAFAEGCDVALVTEEALEDGGGEALESAVAAQPAWSETPFLVLTRRDGSDERARRTVGLMGPLRNATAIERPVRPAILVAAVEGALRDRQRQGAARDANARADAALAASDMGTWIWDLVEDRVHADRNLAAIFGIPPEAARDIPVALFFEALHPHDRRRVRGQIERAVAAGAAYETDTRVVGAERRGPLG